MKKKQIVFIGIVVSGFIILVVGLYYSIIKAGIPYQDPTPEMLEQYNRDARMGEILTLAGIIVEGICAVGFGVWVLVKKLRR